MTEPTEKPHISQTQLTSYECCGEAYRRRYCEGEKIPPGIVMVKGTGVHGGSKANFKQKIESKIDLPRADIIDISVSEFDNSVKKGILLTQEEESIGYQNIVGKARDSVMTFGGLYADYVAPEYQPQFVEQKHKIEIPTASHDLLCYMDIADIRDIVTDLKTASKKKNQKEVDDSEQLSFYALVFKAITGHLPSAVRLETLILTPKIQKPDHQMLEATRTIDDLQVILNRINAMLKGIKAGIFIPALATSWQCLSMDTEILTKEGWKTYNDMNDSDKTLTLNPYSHLLEWQSPSQRFVKKHSTRKMVCYTGRSINFCVTPDHRMYVRSVGRGKWRWTTAKQVEGKGSMAFPVAGYLNKTGVQITDDWLALSGWLCAEGHFRKNSCMIEIAQKKNTQGYYLIENLLRKLGIAFTYNYNPKWSGSFRIYKDDSRYIRTHIQNSKYLPSWLWYADARQFRVWLEAFIKGDGSIKSPTSYIVGQKDEKFIDNLQILAITNRIGATKSPRKTSSTGGKYSCLYLLDGITERVTEAAIVGKHYIKDAEAQSVWCVTVPNGTIVTRHKGKVLITGNCSPTYCGYAMTCPYFLKAHKH